MAENDPDERCRRPGPVDYSSEKAPPDYKCGKCKATQRKLWREYNTFLCFQTFLCADCSLAEEGEQGPVGADGKHLGEFGRTNQIGMRFPAVPTEEGDTYWGYTSTPNAGWLWWERLPT